MAGLHKNGPRLRCQLHCSISSYYYYKKIVRRVGYGGNIRKTYNCGEEKILIALQKNV